MWKPFFIQGMVVCSVCFCHGALANRVADNQQFIESLRDNNDALRYQAPHAVPGLTPANKLPALDEAWLNQLRKKQQAVLGQQEKPQPKALYFVSFSIPEAALIRMLPEAQQLGIPTLVNGLVDNDFRKTVETVFRLARETNNGGVQIDPTQFARFGIRSVPALVVVCGDKFDVVRGNIRLQRALESVVSQGECAEVARTMLEKGEAS
ncbi:type-F conjugative transfer system pilin assembly protein TrbC (plasmid) [Edwardsiella tarda]|uniref:type-F conjugative transfer system pilin assembly protein TrbC n=1 Tax=Edwardsiella tarda TaxID=636 RepID=UPI001D049BB7|nr:type-F conjugative transfer system pilin assembly protein TrbC [Edwardsiella tarda]UCQ29569.1 type-F conjugative transfer system pilin assembly protein TrbC [Edwardsiella tarda]